MTYSYFSQTKGPDLILGATDHPWLRGDGLFETLKSEQGQIYFLDRHLKRLRESAAALFFNPYDEDELRHHLVKLVDESQGIARGKVRVTLFSHGEYLITHESAPYFSRANNLYLSPYRRFSSSWLSGKKSLSYGEGSTVLRFANAHDCDDVLFLNERDEIVETGLANILVEIEGEFLTPDLESGCLPGVVRSVLLEHCENVIEKKLTLADLNNASGLYILSSLREIELAERLNVGDGASLTFKDSLAAADLRSRYRLITDSNPNS